MVGYKAEEIYEDFKSGVTLACILALYVQNDQLQPDFRLIYEHPQNRQISNEQDFSRQEVLNNLSYVFNLAIKNNVPIYLKPQEYLEYDQINFLLLQLYYLYCKFKHSQPLFTEEDAPHLFFKDEGRILEDNSQTSGGQSNTTPQKSRDDNQTEKEDNSSDLKAGSMGIIDEVDSVDFSSTMKSGPKQMHSHTPSINQNQNQYIQSQSQQQQQYQFPNLDNIKKVQKINQDKVNQYLIQANQQYQQRRKISNDDEGNVDDEEEDFIQNSDRSRGGSSINDLNIMKQNLKQASQQNMMAKSNNSGSGVSSYRGGSISQSSIPQYQNKSQYQQQRQNSQQNQQIYNQQFQVVHDDNVGIFNDYATLDPNQSAFQPGAINDTFDNQNNLNNPRFINADPYIQERRGLFFEDLRGQFQRQKNNNDRVEISEEQLTQLYYSSVGNQNNQTAQFINQNNFSTHGEGNGAGHQSYGTSGINTQHSKNNSLANTVFNGVSGLARTNEQIQDSLHDRLKITDDNGDLDEIKCLQLLFVPQLAYVQYKNSQPQKAFLCLKASETFYTELNESYTLKVMEYPAKTGIVEYKLTNIETITVKNLIQKQFVIMANDRSQIIVEIIDKKSDNFFQALNYIFQKTNLRKF